MKRSSRLPPAILLVTTGWLAFLLGTPEIAGAQDVRSVPSAPTCEECQVEVERIARLGRLEDPTGPRGAGWVAGTPHGTFYVSPDVGSTSVLVYRTEDGGALSEVIGRRGEGPGEFGVAGVPFVLADSLFVFDRALGRFTVFDLTGQTRPRTAQMMERVDAAFPLPAGRTLIHAISWTPGRVGLPLHVIENSTGEVIRSFGDEEPLVDPRTESTRHLRRTIARSEEDRVWSLAWETSRYEIELWDAETGSRVMTLWRDAEWFEQEPYAPPTRPRDELDPGPERRVSNPIAAWEDEAGLLWVIHSSPTGRFIEVIDPTRGELVTSRPFDRPVSQAVLGLPNVVWSRGPDEQTGMEYVDVWRIRLIRP